MHVNRMYTSIIIVRLTSRLLSDRRALNINSFVAVQNEVDIRNRLARSGTLQDLTANIITFDNKISKQYMLTKYISNKNLPETVMASGTTVFSKPTTVDTVFYQNVNILTKALS